MRVFFIAQEAKMLKFTKGLAVSTAAALCLMAAQPASADTDISVMTQNQYLGGDIAPLLQAGDPVSFNAALVTALQQVAASDFPRRAERLAELVAHRRPHLVALQEVWSFYCVDLAGPIPGYGCNDPSIAGAFNDQLSGSLAALAAAGETYHAVATVENLDLRDVTVSGLPAGVPFQINGVPALLIALDRDVILARADLVEAGQVAPATVPCARPSAQGCNFQAFIQVNTPAGPLAVERGFVAVDATVDGKAYRFVNTHLEVYEPDPTNPVSRFYQAAQAGELLQTLAFTTPPGRSLVVAGDINSSPDHSGVPGPLPLPAPFDGGIVTPYMQFAYNGYVDIWTTQAEPGDGFTCCQVSDLSNSVSLLNERIDMIFARDLPLAVNDVDLVGDRAKDKTSDPALWPSDHASLMAEIQF
jgi:endonuclease/exonuclease/phosphatase family metal-dependent hydrolase